jgi:hypothetical protein
VVVERLTYRSGLAGHALGVEGRLASVSGGVAAAAVGTVRRSRVGALAPGALVLESVIPTVEESRWQVMRSRGRWSPASLEWECRAATARNRQRRLERRSIYPVGPVAGKSRGGWLKALCRLTGGSAGQSVGVVIGSGRWKVVADWREARVSA